MSGEAQEGGDIYMSPLDSKEIQPVHLKGDQSWMFNGSTGVEAKLQFFGHLMWRADSFEKTLMLGGIGGRKKRGWQRMRWLDGITDSVDMTWVWWTPGVGDGQGGLMCYSSWGRKESDTTEQLKWTDKYLEVQLSAWPLSDYWGMEILERMHGQSN